ncbi:MAG: Nif3-like dinuclear metal center hexameric protein [Desulfopila sp.]|jgi:dinuclear metal center YbgI/SA1388 family protein|nr:Nif3-like dinuclear metal center hexameric protein [Desulfopila sp.]
MQPQITDILHALESFAPAALAEKWDNVGLLVGNRESSVDTVLVALDPTNALLDEALSRECDTVITHHPVIFNPLSAIDTGVPSGQLLQKALSHSINIIGCHTNLDSAVDGVNDVLAHGLGLVNLMPLQPATAENEENRGLGRIGNYPAPISRAEFLQRLHDFLHLETVSLAGTLPQQIHRVALCGGSGSEFAPLARRRGADVYLSAEIKHSTAIWANECGFAVIDGGHYATEKPAASHLAEKLRHIAEQKKWRITILLSETEKAPFVSVDTLTSIPKKP